MSYRRDDILIFTGFIALALASQAFAYIDLGTGSYLWQVAVAGIFALLFSLKIFFNKVKMVLTKIFGKKDK
jgi:hypothetical protein